MTIFDLYSRRRRQHQGDVAEIFTYDSVPNELRVQIVHVVWDLLGHRSEYDESSEYNHPDIRESYKWVSDILCREHSLFRLNGREGSYRDYFDEFCQYILKVSSAEKVLDAIEVAVRVATYCSGRSNWRSVGNPRQVVPNAIEELNRRFKDHGFGYQIEGDEVIRVDSTLAHAEIVKPALIALNDERFAGADEELREAFEHFRHDRPKECLVSSLKAFESTMKVACKIKGYAFGEKDTAKNLIHLILENGLVPQYWNSHFSGLRSMLESGIPTARNREGGHGQGDQPFTPPEYLTAYVLHQTAATVLFIFRAATTH